MFWPCWFYKTVPGKRPILHRLVGVPNGAGYALRPKVDSPFSKQSPASGSLFSSESIVVKHYKCNKGLTYQRTRSSLALISATSCPADLGADGDLEVDKDLEADGDLEVDKDLEADGGRAFLKTQFRGSVVYGCLLASVLWRSWRFGDGSGDNARFLLVPTTMQSLSSSSSLSAGLCSFCFKSLALALFWLRLLCNGWGCWLGVS
ncbi:hypothetical protein BJ546DRAFT_980636 [Cryomyces antarcticus]